MRLVIIFITAIILVGGGAPSPASSAQSLGGITLTEITPRIITPNGDSFNDAAFFKFDNTLTGIPLSTAIFDISGAKVANLIMALGDTALKWDGKDESGKVVPAGIYIYSINIGENSATGTIVVAR